MKDQLKFKDFKAAIICFVIGGVIATGLLCIGLGIFCNEKLQSISNKVDGVELIVKK